MHTPEMLDNVSRTVKDDLAATIKKGDKLSVAAACFSIYAYQVLKKQFDDIAEMCFIFGAEVDKFVIFDTISSKYVAGSLVSRNQI